MNDLMKSMLVSVGAFDAEHQEEPQVIEMPKGDVEQEQMNQLMATHETNEVVEEDPPQDEEKSCWAKHKCAYITLGAVLLGVALALTLALVGAHLQWWCLPSMESEVELAPSSIQTFCACECEESGCSSECGDCLSPSESHLLFVHEIECVKHTPSPVFTRVLEETSKQMPEIQTVYVGDRCEHDLGLFLIPDNGTNYICQICKERGLESGSMAFGCHKVHEGHNPDWKNIGCCYDCYRTLGKAQATEVLMNLDDVKKTNVASDHVNVDKKYVYVSPRDRDGFGLFQIPAEGLWYCPFCPEGEQRDRCRNLYNTAFGCYTNDDSEENRAYGGIGCCMKCVNSFGTLEAAALKLKEKRYFDVFEPKEETCSANFESDSMDDIELIFEDLDDFNSLDLSESSSDDFLNELGEFIQDE